MSGQSFMGLGTERVGGEVGLHLRVLSLSIQRSEMLGDVFSCGDGSVSLVLLAALARPLSFR